MSSFLQPAFSGIHKPESLQKDFIQKLAERINQGFLQIALPKRNRYEILEQTENSIHFHSVNVLTGITIGLNDVNIQVDKESNEIRFTVSYWTWAKFSFILCFSIAFLVGFFLMTPLFGIYLFSKESYPSLLTIKTVIIPMVVFWGVIWPWLLIIMHKGPASKCLCRILDEVNKS